MAQCLSLRESISAFQDVLDQFLSFGVVSADWFVSSIPVPQQCNCLR